MAVLMTDEKQVSVFTVTIKQIKSVLMTDDKQVSVFTVTIKQIMSVLMTDEKQVSVFTVLYVSDLRQVGGLIWVLLFPPPIMIIRYMLNI